MILETIGTAVGGEGIKATVSSVIDTFVTPKLEALAKKHRLQSELFRIGIRGGLVEYLCRSYDRHSHVSTLVFPSQRIPLDRLYHPLTVTHKPMGSAESLELTIDSYRDDFLPKFKRVLIIDSAGMGKSTISKFLFTRCIAEAKGTPILVELRQLSSETDVVDHLWQKVCGLSDGVSREAMNELITDGHFVFLLDGFDEIIPAERAMVTAKLQEFMERAGKNQFLLTSRPDNALLSFGEFERFEIRKLAPEEAFQIIRKYDSGDQQAERLIAEIKRPANLEQLRDYLVNPLLVSLLYKAYEWKPTIPLKKHLFYEQVYNALFEMHDISKGGSYVREKRSGLDSTQFHRVLRELSIRSLLSGKVEYPRDEIIQLLDEVRSSIVDPKFRSSDFLDDLLGAVPLFVAEGPFVRWSHKSLQEYFAAKYICTDAKADQVDMLRALFVSSDALRFANALDLCHDVDAATFNGVIVREICNSYLSFLARCREDERLASKSESEIEARSSLVFCQRFRLVPVDSQAGRKRKRKSTKDLERTVLKGLVDVESELPPNAGTVMLFRGVSDYFVIIEQVGITASMIEMLGSKASPLVTRSSKLVGEGRLSVSDIKISETPVVVSQESPFPELTGITTTENLNRILATADTFVINPAACEQVLSEIDMAEKHAGEVRKLFSTLKGRTLGPSS